MDNQEILHSIKSIQWENLLRIYIEKNNIESIEILRDLHVPELIELAICENQILKVNTLRKQ